LDGLNGRVDMTENVIVEFEGRLIEFSKSEQWRRKTEKKIFATRTKKANICVESQKMRKEVGLRKYMKKYFEEMTRNIPYLARNKCADSRSQVNTK